MKWRTPMQPQPGEDFAASKLMQAVRRRKTEPVTTKQFDSRELLRRMKASKRTAWAPGELRRNFPSSRP